MACPFLEVVLPRFARSFSATLTIDRHSHATCNLPRTGAGGNVKTIIDYMLVKFDIGPKLAVVVSKIAITNGSE